jgi:hypothetical protein
MLQWPRYGQLRDTPEVLLAEMALIICEIMDEHSAHCACHSEEMGAEGRPIVGSLRLQGLYSGRQSALSPTLYLMAVPQPASRIKLPVRDRTDCTPSLQFTAHLRKVNEMFFAGRQKSTCGRKSCQRKAP